MNSQSCNPDQKVDHYCPPFYQKPRNSSQATLCRVVWSVCQMAQIFALKPASAGRRMDEREALPETDGNGVSSPFSPKGEKE